MRVSRLVPFVLSSVLLVYVNALAQDQKPPALRLFPVKVEGKWGFIDTSGELRIPAQYSDVNEFGELSVEGIAVAMGDLWGFINSKGEWVVDPRFHLAENCVDDFAAVEMDDGNWRFINRDGDLVDGTGYERVQCFVDGPPAVTFEGDHEWTYLDVKRSRLLPVRQHIPEGFDEGLTPMNAGSIWGYVDESGAFVIAPKFDEASGFSEGLAAVRLGDKWGYVDKSGAIAIPPQFEWAYGFAEGLAGVKLEGKCGFINRDGKFVVPPTFQDVRFFNEDLAAVEKNSKWGYIDKQGNVVVEPRFDNNALPFRAGIAQVRLWDGDLGYINKSGGYVWEPRH
jgi:WG containing repeat